MLEKIRILPFYKNLKQIKFIFHVITKRVVEHTVKTTLSILSWYIFDKQTQILN